MFTSLWFHLDRPVMSLPKRLVLALGLGVLFSWPPAAEAAVDMHQVPIHLSGSSDFPDLVFVAYLTGKPAAAKFVLADCEVPFSPAGDQGSIVVVAVPRVLADKKEGQVDPAWLQPSALGVIHVGIIEPQFAYRHVAFRYQIVKGSKGPVLKLLNPEEVATAQQSPGSDPSLHATTRDEKSQQMLFWGLGFAGLVVLAGGACLLCRNRKRHQHPAGDKSP